MSFLEAELEANGIANWVPELIELRGPMAELDYALQPIIHEGKIRPFGFIVLHQPPDPAWRILQVELANARKLADGCHSFLLFEAEIFHGILLLEQKAETEWQLANLQQALQAVICRTTTEGITQIFCQTGILLHQMRRWYQKPALRHLVQGIYSSQPQIDLGQLQDILEFCFYELSPQKIGAILVWYFAPICTQELDILLPSQLLWRHRQSSEIKLGTVVNNAVLQHVLGYTDGAVILDADGTILGAGAHLKYSRESARAIPAYKGTRHTSAKRFSYDCPHSLVFVVSSDGFLTVFLGGEAIAVSGIYGTTQQGTQQRGTQQDSAQQDSAQKGSAQKGVAQDTTQGTTQLGTAQGKAQQGGVRNGADAVEA
ncbi:MAG: diadenylate cyclase [Elainella sp.]